MRAARRLRLAAALLAGACAAASFESHYREGARLAREGEYAVAAERLEAAIAAAQTRPVPARDLVSALLELSDVYVTDPSLGKQERSEALLLHARELAAEQLPKNDALGLAVAERLGSYYVLTGSWAKARGPLEEYLAGALRRAGPERAYRTQAAAELSTVYGRLGESALQEQLRARIASPGAARKDPEVAEALAVSAVPPGLFFLEPNALDADGTPAWIHFEPADMPLRVAIGTPDSAAADASSAETRAAAVAGFQEWEHALRRLLPWFRLEIREVDPSAPVQVEWKTRPRGYLPARGEIGYRVEGDALRVASRIVLSTQPVPAQKYRVSTGELHAHAMHAFGSALGLADCFRCDSIMSMAWMRAEELRITDVDIRTFEALVARPNGSRIDGAPLRALAGSDASPDVALAAPRPAEAGVLADLPMINTGRGMDVVVDLAREDGPSLVLELDTGATDTVLSTDYARALGISVRAIKEDPYVRETVLGDPIRFWVTGQQVVGGGRGPTHMDYALLGGELLKKYVVDIDFESRRVRFLDSKLHRVGDGGSPPGELILNLEIRGDRPFARLELGNGAIFALIDTGAEGSISLTEERARGLGIAVDRNAPRALASNVLGTEVSAVQKLPFARLGPLELRDAELEIALGDESSVRIERFLQHEGIVGLEILQRYRLRFDYGRGKLGLTPIRPRPLSTEDAPPAS